MKIRRNTEMFTRSLENQISLLQQEIERQDNLNKQLVEQCQIFDDNWNELKEWLEDEIEKEHHTTHWAMKSKMQELEGKSE